MPTALRRTPHPGSSADHRSSELPRTTGADVGVRSRPLSPGPASLADLGIAPGSSRLLLVCSGLLLTEVQLHGTRAVEVLGPGDLLRVGGEDADLLGAEWSLHVLDLARVAVLDGQLATITKHSPAVAERLVRSVGDRARRQLLHRTACQMPRVEDRVLAVLWLLAERWGTLTPRGVELSFALPHARVGRLVGAARPTVTMAIGVLADAGLLTQPAPQRFALDPGSRRLIGGAGARQASRA